MIEFLTVNWPFTLVFFSMLLVQLAAFIASRESYKKPIKIDLPATEQPPTHSPAAKMLEESLARLNEVRNAKIESAQIPRPWEMRLESEPIRLNGELRQLNVELIAVLPECVILPKPAGMEMPECDATIVIKLDGSTYKQRVHLLIGVCESLRVIHYRIRRIGLLTGMAEELPEEMRKKMFEHD